MAELFKREVSDCYQVEDEETGRTKAPLQEADEEANRERAQMLLDQVRTASKFEQRVFSAKEVFNTVCRVHLSAEEVASMGKSLMLPRSGLIPSLDEYGFGISSSVDDSWRFKKKDLIARFEEYFGYDEEDEIEQISYGEWAATLDLFADPSDEDVLMLLFQMLDHDTNFYLMEDDIARLILIQDRISHSLGMAREESESVRFNLEELMMISLEVLKDADSIVKDGQLSMDEFIDFYSTHHSKRVTGAIGDKHKRLLERAKQDTSKSGVLARKRAAKRTSQVRAVSGVIDTDELADATKAETVKSAADSTDA